MITNAIKTFRNLCLVLLLQLCIEGIAPATLHAQPFPETFYVKENTRNRRPVQYVHERETDIMWSKRVWRTLDLREKFNHPLYFPEQATNERKSLFDIIRQGLLDGEIHAFDNPVMDDEFKVVMSKAALDSMFNSFEWREVENPNAPGTFTNVQVPTPLESYSVKQYWMKEDWFFDRQRSVMDVRIVGLCPLKEKLDPLTNEVIGYIPLFWVYFPECRRLFAHSEIYNVKNDAARTSADDLFEQRRFASYVHKESNVYDRSIVNYTTGLDALLESERIQKDVQLMEHDVWHF